jgi:hypothetical protein
VISPKPQTWLIRVGYYYSILLISVGSFDFYNMLYTENPLIFMEYCSAQGILLIFVGDSEVIFYVTTVALYSLRLFLLFSSSEFVLYTSLFFFFTSLIKMATSPLHNMYLSCLFKKYLRGLNLYFSEFIYTKQYFFMALVFLILLLTKYFMEKTVFKLIIYKGNM